MGYSSLDADELSKGPLDKNSARERVRNFAIARLKAIQNSLKLKHYDAARMDVNDLIGYLRRM
tara:strand:- start:1351 stop:1539 length:189 start_codon:yes stop_codon:yes gene_type:complete